MSKSKKAIAKVDALSASLDELESKLEPLFAKPLSETLGSLEAIQQAKLNVVLPYLINDLVFSKFSSFLAALGCLLYHYSVYLKTRGADPKTHPVIGELVSGRL